MYASSMVMPECKSKVEQIATEITVSLKNLNNVVTGYGASLNVVIRCICFVVHGGHADLVREAWKLCGKVWVYSIGFMDRVNVL